MLSRRVSLKAVQRDNRGDKIRVKGGEKEQVVPLQNSKILGSIARRRVDPPEL
jgi:hypothetical protein